LPPNKRNGRLRVLPAVLNCSFLRLRELGSEPARKWNLPAPATVEPASRHGSHRHREVCSSIVTAMFVANHGNLLFAIAAYRSPTTEVSSFAMAAS